MEDKKFKQFLTISTVWVVVVGIISYLISPNYTPLVLIPLIFMFRETLKVEKVEVDKELEKDVESYREAAELLESKLEETIQILDDYEEIFDSQVVNIPCICGDNMFSGILSPNIENEVRCEKCQNLFKISINYDTVLVSEPMIDTTVVTEKIKNVKPLRPENNN